MEKIEALEKMLAAKEAEIERMREALEKIGQWAEAYPVDAFPEPNFKAVRVALEAAGISLDSVSASNMRHVIIGVKKIVDGVLELNLPTNPDESQNEN